MGLGATRQIWTVFEPDATRSRPKEPGMDATEIAYVRSHLADSLAAVQAASADAEFLQVMGRVADEMATAIGAGRKILLCGNGGSAADAQHIAGELLSRFEKDRAPWPAIALTTDSSVLTAIGNDYGYDQVFERQVRGLGMKGDVLIAISTSGRSPNVIRALDAARECGLVTVGFTGTKEGDMVSRCDVLLRAPSDKTPVIQQIHITAAHIICGLVERRLAGAKAGP
jgi:D-sedoheptulose 7-phosphate isomerase